MNREPDDRPTGRIPPLTSSRRSSPGWRREGAVPTWPGDERPPIEPPRTPPFAASPVPPARCTGRTSPRRTASSTSSRRSRRRCRASARRRPSGCTLLVLGLVLVIAPNAVGISNVYGLPLGLLALAAGLGWLVLRLWPAPPDERDEDDDGAQL